ncbi:MAG: OmpA family protein [Verrucomicrobia bacterium]|nr:OmpA family protein [Verrucomicrobiota bacterium]
MAQIGKCTNNVGCTLAYTGQEIRFEGSAVCPECGRPLTLLAKPKTGSKLWLVILALVLLVAIAGGGFYAVERIVSGSDTTKTSATATPSPSATNTSTSDGKMVDGKSQVPADVLNKANNQSGQSPSPATSAASPSVTPSPEVQQSPPGPNESTTPGNGDKPPQGDASPPGGKSPAGNANPDVRHQNPSPQKSPDASGGGDNSGQTVDTKPKELSSAELGATKEDIKKRINAIPRMSDSEKTKLIDKLDSAQYMQRVGVVYFPTGSNVLPKPAVDKLVSLFKAPELVQKMSDPTLVFIVAGYADMTGDPKGNYKLSDERAQAVANVLPDAAGVLNLVRTVPMGGTDLLSGRRPDQNRAVEIWAVIPQ